MTLPHSMDYLVNGGVLDFDAAAYLNNTNVGGVNYNTNLLGGVQMQNQPQNDNFATKAKKTMTDKNFLKKVATAALVTVLVGVALCNGKNVIKAVKDYNYTEGASNAFSSVKNGVCNFFKNVFKK